jgi:hypothetical protein
MRAKVWKNRVRIICPACREIDIEKGYDAHGDVAGVHEVPFTGATTVWQFDGNVERPTLSPSLLLTYEGGEPSRRFVCHTFVNGGRIQYLADCTHRFAGQTVDLPEFPVT